MSMDQAERRLLNDYQRDFPLVPRPFAHIADALNLREEDVLTRLADLQAGGTVSRVGAVVRPNTVGASTLAAMAVPAERLQAVAELVSARPEVNHNYEREHALNLWFVVAAADQAAVQAVLDSIAAETGLPVIDLPLQTAYHIDLGFDLS
jgi:DNA-binding Lrp family transcriptional regulator